MQTLVGKMIRNWMAASALVLVLVACGEDPSVESAQSPFRPSFDPTWVDCNNQWEGTPENSLDDFEEEILGSISAAAGTFGSAALFARDAETGNNQPSRDSTVDVNTGTCSLSPFNGHNNIGAEWGFYGIGSFNNNCNYASDKEHHRALGDEFPGNQENHCADAGRFRVEFRAPGETLSDAPDFVRPVDFIQYAGPITIPGEANTGLVEVAAAIGSHTPGNDILLNYTTTSATNPTATLQVSATLPSAIATASWTEAPVSGGKAQVPSNFTVRVGTWTSDASCGDAHEMMVRYFWDWPSTSGPTGFVNVRNCDGGGSPLIRIKSYSQGEHTILAHVVAPWQHPSLPYSEAAVNYGDTAAVIVNAYTPLTVTDIWSNDATPPILVNENISYGTTGQNGSGSNQFRWTWAPGDITDWTSSTTVPKTFTTSGLKTITVQKKDSNGYIFSYTEQIYIHVPLVAVIGTNYQGGSQPAKNQSCQYNGGYTGGYGTVTRNWYKRPVGGSWTHLGSTTDVTISVGTTAFELKLNVADGFQTASQTITVTPPASGGATCVL